MLERFLLPHVLLNFEFIKNTVQLSNNCTILLGEATIYIYVIPAMTPKHTNVWPLFFSDSCPP